MGLGTQLIWASLYLSLCTVFHAFFLTWFIRRLRVLSRRFPDPLRRQDLALLMVLLLLAVVFAHTVEVWLWAHALIRREALETWSDAVYFALVTYTTLGYGDIVLGAQDRVFGAMASVSGLLNFGISTAILVAAWSRMFAPEQDRP